MRSTSTISTAVVVIGPEVMAVVLVPCALDWAAGMTGAPTPSVMLGSVVGVACAACPVSFAFAVEEMPVCSEGVVIAVPESNVVELVDGMLAVDDISDVASTSAMTARKVC